VLVGAGVLLYAAWVGASILGVAGGGLLGDPQALGLDAALLAGQVRDRRALLAAGAGGVIALAMVPFTPPGVPIVVAALACLAGLRERRTPA
jgi:predicted branched-subunit amino acid permease